MRRSFQGSSAGASRERPPAREDERFASRRLFLGGLVLLAAGCSGGGSGGPQVSPREAARAALAEYDANQDGALDAKELERCPALWSALKRIDKNNDGRLTADEIADRLTFLRRQEALTGIGVEVSLDGRPLSGATVTLEPEKFMGPSFKPVSAVTDEIGTGTLQGGGPSEEAVPLGYYRVLVSKKNARGEEMIPARYNTKTVLGQEIAPDAEGRRGFSTVRLPLTSR
jgi:EF hand